MSSRARRAPSTPRALHVQRRPFRRVAQTVVLGLLSACADRAPANDTSATATATATAAAAAAATASATAIRQRLAAYAAAAAAVDADGSASFFAPAGTLFEPGIPPIVTPDSIRAFIRSFPGVKVDSAMLRADTVRVYGRTAFVWGTYFERLHFPGQPASAQHGRFVMEWRQAADSVWRIERYYRVPLPPGWRDGS